VKLVQLKLKSRAERIAEFSRYIMSNEMNNQGSARDLMPESLSIPAESDHSQDDILAAHSENYLSKAIPIAMQSYKSMLELYPMDISKYEFARTPSASKSTNEISRNHVEITTDMSPQAQIGIEIDGHVLGPLENECVWYWFRTQRQRNELPEWIISAKLYYKIPYFNDENLSKLVKWLTRDESTADHLNYPRMCVVNASRAEIMHYANRCFNDAVQDSLRAKINKSSRKQTIRK
jgi:hypothetical protein